MVLWTYWSFWKQVCHDYFSNSPPLCACVLCVWLIKYAASTWQEICELCLCVADKSKVTFSTCHDMGVPFVCLLWCELQGDLQYVSWHGWTICMFALVITRRWPPVRVMTWVNHLCVCSGENSKVTSRTCHDMGERCVC